MAEQLALLENPGEKRTVGYCAECGKTPTVTAAGLLYAHDFPEFNAHDLKGRCPGSGTEPRKTWLVAR